MVIIVLGMTLGWVGGFWVTFLLHRSARKAGRRREGRFGVLVLTRQNVGLNFATSVAIVNAVGGGEFATMIGFVRQLHDMAVVVLFVGLGAEC